MARLFRTREEERSLWQRIKDVALTDVNVLVQGLDEGSLDALEEALLGADFGPAATLRLVDHVERLSTRGKIRTVEDFRRAVEEEVAAILDGGAPDRSLHFAADGGPSIFLILGVNGVGKTTSIGKLAHRLGGEGKRVLLAAGDTFRAGAIEQLRIWAERTGADFVGAKPGADPASVAFDAIEAAERRSADVVLLDTAGRLHTQGDLMAELTKVQRVVARKRDGAPHESLLVLDATTGQNALSQVRTFATALPLTGLILAKLDSSARGGVVVALQQEGAAPVKLVGTGEQAPDLEPFDARAFAREVMAA
ncbi:MAG TPA: signal recognition particle-docking protein FtsY [Longimicrobiales bacterium]|nr:signal recognition particle-docking protein FtsY [Longimicrobiales bacterium]